MAWSAKFVKGVSDMTDIKKLDPPVAKALPNVQAFANSVDSAEKMEAELEKAHKELTKAAEAYNKVVEQFEKLEDAIDKNSAVFDKAVKAYIKQGRDYSEKAYQTGCTGMEAGLAEIDKEILAMKRKYSSVKLK